MKRGFLLSTTTHSLLFSLLLANGVFFMPEREYQNLNKLDILVLTEAEFDAMTSSPPISDNFSEIISDKPEIITEDLNMNSSVDIIKNLTNQHDIAKLNSTFQKFETAVKLNPIKNLRNYNDLDIEKKIDDQQKKAFENQAGNEINFLDINKINIPKPRNAERIDRIASNDKSTENISNNFTSLLNDELKNSDLFIKEETKRANKKSTTEITPDSHKDVEIVSGAVETSTIPPKRNLSNVIENAKFDENLNGDLQDKIEELLETVNKSEDIAGSNNEVPNSSISTMEKLKLRKSINQLIGRYWNKGILIGVSDFENYVVKVEILLDNKGNIVGNVKPIEPAVPYGRYAIAFREASNAIKAVGKIPISSEKYKKGLKLKLTFDPAVGIGFD